MNKKCKQCEEIKDIKDFPSKAKNFCRVCCQLNIDNKIKQLLSKSIEPQKECTICKKIKNYLEFYPKLTGGLGRESVCIKCNKIQAANYQIKQKQINLKLSDTTSRKCSICLEAKIIDNFLKDSTRKFGCQTICKECKRTEIKIKITSKNCRICNIEKQIECFDESYRTADGLATLCKDCRKIERLKYREADRVRCKFRYKNDVEYKLKKILRTIFRHALKSQSAEKSLQILNLVGLNIKSLKLHLEKQFELGMTWENNTKNGWHIDHIIPCDAFDLAQESEQKKCFHYTNLMPRWATTEIAIKHGSKQIGNINKHKKILPEYQTNSSIQVSVV